MSALGWALFLVGVALISAYAVTWYRTREDPVRGRAVAAVLRASALSLAWLLLLNPSVPNALGGRAGPVAVLLDASLSMDRASDDEDGTLWDQALDSVPEGAEVWLFGGASPRRVTDASLAQGPTWTESRLAPAVRAAAASGARRLAIVSDAGITDTAAAADELRRHGLEATFVGLGVSYPQTGIARVRALPWVVEGDSGWAEVEVVAAGTGADSLTVQIIDEVEGVLAATRVGRPQLGRFNEVRLSFRLRGATGQRRLVARLNGDSLDLERRDNDRAFYVEVSERPAGAVLLSLRPDWEPTFLLPNLDRLTDAPVRAYMQLADSLVGLADFRSIDLATVQRQAGAAPLLIVHGFAAEAPAWLQELVRSANRLLLFPDGDRPFTLPGWGIQIGAPAAGEWYLASEVPPSPLALSLEAEGWEALPPLTGLRRIAGGDGFAAIAVQRLRRGEARPALAMGRVGERRWAIAAGHGYWRWGFRPDRGKSLYRALWAGVGDWLLREGSAAVAGLPPLRRVVPRGEPLVWLAPGSSDSLVITVQRGDSSLWRGSTVGGDSLKTFLSPGRYEYLASAHEPGQRIVTARGPLEVEEFTPEFLPRPVSRVEGKHAAYDAGSAPGERGLAGLGWPFLIVIALFCAEWSVRRFNGLS